MSFVSEEMIDKIRERNDIVEVASDYLSMKRTGANFKALCPFHMEKTPSFVINQQKQIFHCFGCGVGGNVFNFLMRIEKVEFPEAVRTLAERAGIEISFREKEKWSKEEKEKEQSLNLIKEAAGFYHKSLIGLPEAKYARDYLVKRKIDKNTILKYKLGYAGFKLREHLTKQRFTLRELTEAGLFINSEKGYYPRLRQRIIFPIFDIKDRIIGFGGRVLNNNLPKYINSPDNRIYHKGEVLYGLNWAKDQIRTSGEVFIVEGYFDLIRMQMSGIENTVATLGTALTVNQVKWLRRFSERVYFVYDPDTAGQAAALRGMELVREEGLDVKVISLPDGEDPDSFLLKKNQDVFLKLAGNALDFFDFYLLQSAKKYNIKTAGGQSKVIEEAAEVIHRCSDPVEKSVYLKKLSEKLDLKDSLVKTALNELKKKKRSPKGISKIIDNKKRSSNTEKKLIQLLIKNQEFVPEAREKIIPDDMTDPVCKRIYEEILTLYSKGKEIQASQITTYWPDSRELQNCFTELVCEEVDYHKEEEKFFKDYVKKIKSKEQRKKRMFLLSEITSADAKKDEGQVKKLQREFQELKNKPEGGKKSG